MKKMNYNHVTRGVAFFLLFVIILSCTHTIPLLAHGDEIEMREPQKEGEIHLEADQAKAIDLKTTQPSIQPLAQLLSLNGEVRPLPNSQAEASVRINGQVTELYANIGDTVRKGQKLAKVQSFLVGDPPPSVIVTAPIDGIIDVRNVKLGQSVQPNTALFSISNRDPIMVVANLYEEDIGKVKVGQTANINVLSYPARIFKGKVSLIEPNLDPLTRTVNVQIALSNPQGLLRPNMSAQANIVLEENTSAITVPNAAILEANGEKFVFTQNGENYKRVVITTGTSDHKYTEIKTGIKINDKVVIQGHRQLYTVWLTGGSHNEGKE
ncbi:MAG: efflux RND transporter periplasmic adaptor subunit [Alphaproteobacteria bacterium]|nr:efflux RND transporter periplasmic adaptor subunit [Alphaproteobacteria bacterium]